MNAAAGSTVWTADRRRITLASLVKSGGAGSVYLLAESRAQVAKIYHPGAGLDGYRRKVAAMLSLSPQLPEIDEGGARYVQIAWPQAALQDDRGRFLGFLMPALDVAATRELEYVLQERQARAEGLPTGLGPKVTLAANLGAVIAELHRQRHFVVDLKPVNLRFYRKSLYMAMLDCDGFSIQGQGERFPAEQVTPDYLAPEFQARGLETGEEEAQDRFALAVVIFQLLNFGIHPFTGRPQSDRVPTDIPGRIAGRYYAYGLQANPQLAPVPSSGHACFPADLRRLFDRAFGASPAARPAAIEWSQLLREYAQRSRQQLVGCAKDPAHQHFAGLPCAACARAALVQQATRQQAAAQAPTLARKVLRWRSPLPGRGTPPTRSPRGATPGAWSPLPTNLPPAPRSGGWPTNRSGGGLSWSQVWAIVRLALVAIWLGGSWLIDQFKEPSGSLSVSTAPARIDIRPLLATAPDTDPAPTPAADERSGDAPTHACADGPIDLDSEQGRIMVVAGAAAARAEDEVVQRAFDTLMRGARGTGAPEAPLPAWTRQRFDQYAAAGDYGNQYVREQMIDSIERHLVDHPQSVHAAYRRGWLALSDGRVPQARAIFACGIAIDPRLPDNWYGLAIASQDDQDAAGFLAVSDLLAPTNAQRSEIRARFGDQLLNQVDIGRDAAALQRIERNAAVAAQRLAADRVTLPTLPSDSSL